MDSSGVSPLRSSPTAAFYLSVSSFVFLRRLLSKLLGGAIFIVGFRSRRSQGDQDRRHRSHEGEKEVPHAARYRGRVGPPNFLLGLLFSRILGSDVFFLPHIGPRKILGHLDVVWVPEGQKTLKKGFSGSAWLIPEK